MNRTLKTAGITVLALGADVRGEPVADAAEDRLHDRVFVHRRSPQQIRGMGSPSISATARRWAPVGA